MFKFKYLSSSRKKQWRDNRNSSSKSFQQRNDEQDMMSITIDGMKSTSITTSNSTDSNSSSDYEEELHTKTDKEKDILIQQLQEAMEREQKIQDERVIMLQIQIERLIEMRSKSCGSSTLQTPRDIGITALNEDDKHQHALIEISSLNELLSRILGERDVLSVKVRNLERLIKEMPTRKKIDHDIIYQLTCKKCEGGSIHTIGKTSQDLKSTVKKHYKEVYMMVERYKEAEEGEGDEDYESNNSSAFMQSSFATHIVKHIINQSQGAEVTEKKVFEWCQRNIRVESFSIDLC